ncbi:MAG: hypothetical protein PHN80_12420 [Hespellia sp.]|nr:hypothetical protein [Hespellia sp.]
MQEISAETETMPTVDLVKNPTDGTWPVSVQNSDGETILEEGSVIGTAAERKRKQRSMSCDRGEKALV